MIVYTANPEDYTNRGNIITPLKDRIDSQILTHYPKTIDHAIKITEHEAWVKRDDQYPVILPNYLKELVEQIAFEARKSDYVDHKSGVSARMSISVMENLISNAERRAIFSGETMVIPRFSDFHFALPGMTGKMELVFEGEQEGAVKVGKALIGKAVREVFINYFPEPYPKKPGSKGRPADPFAPRGGKPVNLDVVPVADDSYYQEIINWFNQGNKLELADEMNSEEYFKQLDKIPGLKRIATQHLKPGGSKAEVSAAMEFVLEALYQNSRVAKEEAEVGTVYKDMLGSLFRND
jgi:magnesium chelatase subunit I